MPCARFLCKALAVLAVVCLSACSDPEKDRLRETTRPTYDKTTGRLKELTFDANRNGKIDTWTEMDGARPVRSRIDSNEDGKPERWEYYDASGQLQKVGFSRSGDGKPDAWAFSGADGRIERIESSSLADERKIDRWEHYDAAGLVRTDEDTNGNGAPDKWQTFKDGAVETASFDENADGRPDRRLTYERGVLVLIETEPDGNGRYARRVEVR
jgi:hypothetical protein